MNTKNILAFIMFIVAGLFLYSFVLPFKSVAVDEISQELDRLSAAYTQADQQLSLKTLRAKRQQLSEQDLQLLQNFVPQNLHAGHFVYNLGQMANQNRLVLKGLQFSVINPALGTPNAAKVDKKLQVNFTMEGRYEDFVSWLTKIENSNVLIDVESIRGFKSSNTGDTINFNVILYAYGLNVN